MESHFPLQQTLFVRKHPVQKIQEHTTNPLGLFSHRVYLEKSKVRSRGKTKQTHLFGV